MQTKKILEAKNQRLEEENINLQLENETLKGQVDLLLKNLDKDIKTMSGAVYLVTVIENAVNDFKLKNLRYFTQFEDAQEG